MARKDPRNTRRKIVTAAWKLFYEQDDRTTVDQIILAPHLQRFVLSLFQWERCSLSSLSSLFDDTRNDAGDRSGDEQL